MLCRSSAVAAMLLAATFRVASAQQAISGEIGTERLLQVGLPKSTLITGGLGYSSRRDFMTWAADILGGRGKDGVGTGRVAGAMAVYSEALGHGGFESALLVDVFGTTAQRPSTSVQLSVKNIHQGYNDGRYWAVRTGARVWEGEPLPLGTGELGMWRERAPGYFALSANITATTPDRLSPKQFGYTEFSDAVAEWHKTLGKTTFTLSGGARFGFGNIADSDPRWAEGSLAQGVGKSLQLVLASGRTPSDIVRGIPSSRFASVTVRTSYTLPVRPNRP